LALRQAPLDAVVSGLAIHHLPHQRQAALYAEIAGLLAPGGIFVNIEHVASASAWATDRFQDAMIDSLYAHQERLGRGLTRQQVSDMWVHREDQQANLLAPVETQLAWLRAAGLTDVDCYFRIFELAVLAGRQPSEG